MAAITSPPLVQDGSAEAASLAVAARKGLSAAVEATTGVIGTPLPLATAPSVAPAPVTINPTIYPQGPGGTVIVVNSITINIHGAGFANLKGTLHELLKELRGSNEASQEVKRQLSGEITAGMAIAKTSKADRGALQRYLVDPLKAILREFKSDVIRELAAKALKFLTDIASELFKD